MSKPTNSTELYTYLEDHPWLRRATVPGDTFKARVDRKNGVIWEGKRATYFYVNSDTFPTKTTYDETGFTVVTQVHDTTNTLRFEYTDDPDKPCQQTTSTPGSTPAATSTPSS